MASSIVATEINEHAIKTTNVRECMPLQYVYFFLADLAEPLSGRCPFFAGDLADFDDKAGDNFPDDLPCFGFLDGLVDFDFVDDLANFGFAFEPSSSFFPLVRTSSSSSSSSDDSDEDSKSFFIF